MEKWEYNSMTIDWSAEKDQWVSGSTTNRRIDLILDRYGNEGWELVNLVPSFGHTSVGSTWNVTSYWAHFKRRKQ